MRREAREGGLPAEDHGEQAQLSSVFAFALTRHAIQIDCSHGNSSKQHAKQIEVAEDIVRVSRLTSMVGVES